MAGNEMQLAKPGTLSALLGQYKDQIATALPRHLSVDRMIRVALTAVTRTPDLQKCDVRTVAAAVIQASVLGLEPDGVLGQAYLIPYGTTCQLIPGYKGLIQLVRNSGQLIFVDAQAVRKGDTFDYEYGLHPQLLHKRSPAYEKEASIAFWAAARLKDGGEQISVMSRGEVEQIRDKHSKAKNNGPWKDHFDEMGKKTVLRRLCKLLPMSVQVQTAVALDEAYESNTPQGFSVDLPLELQPPIEPTSPTIEAPKELTPTGEPHAKIDDRQRQRIWTIARTVGLDAEATSTLIRKLGFEQSSDVTVERYEEVLATIEAAAGVPA